MLLGCIADDFTGASDLANTLARAGMATTQLVGVPPDASAGTCEAGVVALKTRSIPADEAVAQSLAALRWLRAQGCRQFLFKYCSTFDSTPEGNIGPVALALLDALDAPGAFVCPVFPATGRTLYMGHLFVGDRLLSESGMQRHPLTPMTDPDIRRWLGRQIQGEAGLVRHDAVRRGSAAISEAWRDEVAAGRKLVVVDAITDDDLRAIGHAARDHALITGGSGIALGLPENFRAQGLLSGERLAFEPLLGPAAVLSGSCSSMSLRQVDDYRQDHPALAVTPDALLSGDLTVQIALGFARKHLADAPLIYSSADPDSVSRAQATHGRDRAARAVEAFFGELAAQLIQAGVTRLAVGGGETSGAVVGALSLRQLAIGPEIDPGVPVLSASPVLAGPQGIRLALKSGNFGAPDFYRKALRQMSHAAPHP
ncbi:FIG00641944: hypothetical protein [plant metagenome]|uniref:3-oxo-tetronate kinase n=1 Tax=plant metagenome TaxID=1297885 RepID=A0A484V8E4_9ZZZZ